MQASMKADLKIHASGWMKRNYHKLRKVQFMRITVHWHVTPCNLVADYRHFGGTPFRHLTLQQLLRNVGNLPPDVTVSHSSTQNPHGVAEFQSRLVSGQSLEPDISIVICDNLTDVQPIESPVNTAKRCFLPRIFAKMLF